MSVHYVVSQAVNVKNPFQHMKEKYVPVTPCE